ncbi:MAG: F0F1 ATP synthase subunit B [Bacteroidota bacterium]
MELVQPSWGLIFWMTISFLIIFFLLAKFAWKPILGMIKEREDSIEAALASAEQAKVEMKLLKSENEKILAEARGERDSMLKEAREIKDKIIAEAKTSAVSEGERLLKSARENIQNEKMAAITDLKNQVAVLSIEIAEKILKTELSSDDKQKSLVKNLLQDVNLN